MAFSSFIPQGGSQPAQQTPQEKENSPADAQTQGKENNTGPDADPLVNIWDDPKSETDEKKEPTSRTDAQNPTDAANEYFNQVGLGETEISEADFEAVQTREGFQSFVNKQTQLMRNVLARSLSDSKKMADRAAEAAVEKAIGGANANRTLDTFNNNLQTDFPDIASDPVLKPVVESIAGRLYAQGKNHKDVMKGVQAFLDRAAQKSGNSSQANPNFGGSHRGSVQGGDIDWSEFLKGNN